MKVQGDNIAGRMSKAQERNRHPSEGIATGVWRGSFLTFCSLILMVIYQGHVSIIWYQWNRMEWNTTRHY